jgi:undecaprenyl diphosphate synthase
MQSEQNKPVANRLHVAIIMDGNGRWATARRMPRIVGHREGAKAVRRVIEAAPGLGIGTLTLYAFSSDNWQRPAREVAALMQLLEQYLRREQPRCLANGVRLNCIGRRDRMPTGVLAAMAETESATAHCTTLLLRLALDYSARDQIVLASQRLAHLPAPTRDDFARALAEVGHAVGPVPDVDLLVRTSGEQRISDFLLWEIAYAEMYFTPRLWPDFSVADLAEAVAEFHRRDRRFGGVHQSAAG